MLVRSKFDIYPIIVVKPINFRRKLEFFHFANKMPQKILTLYIFFTHITWFRDSSNFRILPCQGPFDSNANYKKPRTKCAGGHFAPLPQIVKTDIFN
jgi:hypothetical protein